MRSRNCRRRAGPVGAWDCTRELWTLLTRMVWAGPISSADWLRLSPRASPATAGGRSDGHAQPWKEGRHDPDEAAGRRGDPKAILPGGAADDEVRDPEDGSRRRGGGPPPAAAPPGAPAAAPRTMPRW